jgi:hypothetical protein
MKSITHYTSAIGRIGDPVAPASFSGIAMKTNSETPSADARFAVNADDRWQAAGDPGQSR